MKKLLAIIVAAAFASTALAQKDVTDKKGGTVTDKKGAAVTTKAMKEKPKNETKISMPKGKVKSKEPKSGGNVTTKRGEQVTNKKGDEVKSGQK